MSSLIGQAKKETYQSKTEDGKDDSKTVWKLFKELDVNGKENNCEPNISIKIDGTLVQNDSDFGQLFRLRPEDF